MNSKSNELIEINQADKDIVFGYLKKDSSDVPMEILILILVFYYEKMTFNTNIYGKNLAFMDNVVFKKTQKLKWSLHGKWSTCIFGFELRKRRCKKLILHVKWTNCVNSFYMGFITSTINNSIKDWNDHLGSDKNKENSVGIWVNPCFYTLFISDWNNRSRPLSIRIRKPAQNDIFKLLFDLQSNELLIDDGRNDFDKISLKNALRITPAFSLRDDDEELQIVKCDLIY